jgi:hypothetical protein
MFSHYVLPSLSSDGTVSHAERNAILVANILEQKLSCRVVNSHLTNIFIVKLGKMLLGSFNPSSVDFLVNLVVFGSSPPKVFKSVVGAVSVRKVASHHSIWARCEVQQRITRQDNERDCFCRLGARRFCIHRGPISVFSISTNRSCGTKILTYYHSHRHEFAPNNSRHFHPTQLDNQGILECRDIPD